MNEIKSINPKNLGWLQSKLDEEEIGYLWIIIAEKGEDMKGSLVGQIDSSYSIIDKDSWFFINVLSKLGVEYERKFQILEGGFQQATNIRITCQICG